MIELFYIFLNQFKLSRNKFRKLNFIYSFTAISHLLPANPHLHWPLKKLKLVRIINLKITQLNYKNMMLCCFEYM